MFKHICSGNYMTELGKIAEIEKQEFEREEAIKKAEEKRLEEEMKLEEEKRSEEKALEEKTKEEAPKEKQEVKQEVQITEALEEKPEVCGDKKKKGLLERLFSGHKK